MFKDINNIKIKLKEDSMAKFFFFTLVCLILIPGILMAQEVKISGFPVDVGTNIEQEFYKPYYESLQKVADTLKKYPQSTAIITGSADGENYRQFHDTKNAAIALSRAHSLRIFMTQEFSILPTQFVISTEEIRVKSPENRYVSVRVVRETIDLDDRMTGELAAIGQRLKALENKPPIEKHFTEIQKESAPAIIENFGVGVHGGVSTSPFGGIPIVGGSVNWQRKVFLEATVGHTFWNNQFLYEELNLETKRRLFGGHFTYYLGDDNKFGIVAGWMRIEEISQKYYEYIKLSEGPMFGLKFTPYKSLALNLSYNPSKHRTFGTDESHSKNGQFLLSLTIFDLFGGEK